MKADVRYELKMFSANLEVGPEITFNGMDVIIELKGYDDSDNYHECRIKFNSVIGYQYTLAGFTVTLDSYDRIVEIKDTKWIEQFKEANEQEIGYWNPKHYAIYLDEVGLYQFLAQNFDVEER